MLESHDEAKRITEYMNIAAPAQEADLLFVFGNALPKPAFIAAEVMAENRAKHVVLTGGNHKREGVNEAESHQKILLECGISPECIILENESQNTRENVLFALPRIIKRLELDDVKSVMVLALWQHCRRATMTLKRHL
ncbi:MAG: YdcF family protein, partial [Cytophagaceae bacterium]